MGIFIIELAKESRGCKKVLNKDTNIIVEPIVKLLLKTKCTDINVIIIGATTSIKTSQM